MYTEFQYTKDGCKKALEYIRSIGKYELLEKELSTDGFTAVYLANTLRSMEQGDE